LKNYKTPKFLAGLERKLQESIFVQGFKLLNLQSRRRMIYVVVIQILIGILDLVGIGLIGALGAIVVRGVQSQPPTGKIQSLLSFIGLEEASFQTQVALIGIIATLVLFLRHSFLYTSLDGLISF
jgi:hypothetical protein